MQRIAIICLFSAVLPVAAAHGLGGGGIFWGETTLVPGFVYAEEVSNSDARFSYSGGYGYGVGKHGQRHGGFGMVIAADDDSPEDLFGAFGGGMTGAQMRLGPVTASVNMYLGVGGFGGSRVPVSGGLAGFGELNGEIGVRLVSWMQVSLYGGIQGMTHLGSPQNVYDSAIYTPVIGTRITWGAF